MSKFLAGALSGALLYAVVSFLVDFSNALPAGPIRASIGG